MEQNGARVQNGNAYLSHETGDCIVECVADKKHRVWINGVQEMYVDSSGLHVVNGPLTVDAGGLVVTAGGLTVTAGGLTITAGVLDAHNAGLRTIQSVANVTEAAPTAAQLTSAFGSPATLGRGFIGTVDDNDGDAANILCWTSDASWYHVVGVKSV